MKINSLTHTLAAAILLSITSLPLSAAMVTKFGTNVSFTYDNATLFGDGIVVGDSIKFFPTDFKATATGVTVPIDLVDVLNIQIQSLNSELFFLDKMNVIERGDYTLSKPGSQVSATLRTEVTSLTGMGSSQAVTTGTGALTTPDDLAASTDWMITNMNDWGWQGETLVNFQLQNTLIADSDDADGFASIQKKFGDIEITVNPIPLPAAVWFMGAGIAGLLAFTKRRAFN